MEQNLSEQEKKQRLLDAMSKQSKEGTIKKDDKKANPLFFATNIPDGKDDAKKKFRILQTEGSESPFEIMHIHSFYDIVQKQTIKVPCLKHNFGEKCPYCEKFDEVNKPKTKESWAAAKEYSARKAYVCKGVYRDDTTPLIRFYRFLHDFRNMGIYDKIMDIVNEKGDIFDIQTGRDLIFYIKKNDKGKAIISSIMQDDVSPLHSDPKVIEALLADKTTWKDAYDKRDYNYLKITLDTKSMPVYSKEKECYVPRTSNVAASTNPFETNQGNVNFSNPSTAEDDMPF